MMSYPAIAHGLTGPPTRGETLEIASLRYLGQHQKLYLLFEQGDELVLNRPAPPLPSGCSTNAVESSLHKPSGAPNIFGTALVGSVQRSGRNGARILFKASSREWDLFLKASDRAAFALKELAVVLPETKQREAILVEEVLDSFQNERPTSSTDVQHRIAASAACIACRAVIGQNDSLAIEEVTRLCGGFIRLRNVPYVPAWPDRRIIRFPLSELHRRFRRDLILHWVFGPYLFGRPLHSIA